MTKKTKSPIQKEFQPIDVSLARVFSLYITAAVLVFLNNEELPLLVFQIHLGIKLF